MNEKEPWADEPTPLCDGERVEGMSHEACFGKGMYPGWKDSVDVNFARSLERRLRWCQEKLRQISKETVHGRQSLAASVAKGTLAELEKPT